MHYCARCEAEVAAQPPRPVPLSPTARAAVRAEVRALLVHLIHLVDDLPPAEEEPR